MAKTQGEPDHTYDVVVYGVIDQQPESGAARDRFHVYLGPDKVRTYGAEAAALDGARELAKEKGCAAWMQGPGDAPIRPIALE